MANIKKHFNKSDSVVKSVASEKPKRNAPVEQISEGEEFQDDYSRQVAESRNKGIQPKEQPGKGNKIKGLKVSVSGGVRIGDKEEGYNVEVVIPYCPDNELQYHIQRFVVLELHKQKKLGNGVITRYIDNIEECEVELTFIGKNVFDLSKEETQLAADYYNIKCLPGNTPSLVAIQRSLYVNYKIKTSDDIRTDPMKRALYISKIDGIKDKAKLPDCLLEA